MKINLETITRRQFDKLLERNEIRKKVNDIQEKIDAKLKSEYSGCHTNAKWQEEGEKEFEKEKHSSIVKMRMALCDAERELENAESELEKSLKE